MGKSEKLTWFRLYVANEGAISKIDNESLGIALKAAYAYANSYGLDETIEHDLPQDFGVQIAFGIFKQGADDSIKEHRQSVENGIKGAEARRKKEREEAKKEALEEYFNKYGTERASDEGELPFS